MGALENLAGVVYGGHVPDPEDLEEVGCVARGLLSPVAPPCWGGPGGLLSIIDPLPDHHDTAGLLLSVERRVWSVTDPSDPPPLGLSPEQAETSLRTRSHTLHTLLRLSHAPSGGGEGVPGPRSGTPEDRPGRSFAERLAALDDRLRAPRCTDEDAIVDPAGGPIQDFLWAEWAALGGLQASLLARCVRRQQGRRDPLLDGDLSRLERQAEHIATYLRGGAEAMDPPAAYRPSAFANPRGFLAAVLREGAQRRDTEPSHLTLDFQVTTEGERSLPGAQVLRDPNSSPAPAPGSVHLCGLQLRGALWDTRLGAVRDSASTHSCSLPMLRVTPRHVGRHSDRSRGSATPPDPSDALGSDAGPLSCLFRCPLYVEGGHGPLTWVPLATELDPGWCRLRRVRLVSTL
ncbi:unnamed protein product [Arctogadus glacialis]